MRASYDVSRILARQALSQRHVCQSWRLAKVGQDWQTFWFYNGRDRKKTGKIWRNGHFGLPGLAVSESWLRPCNARWMKPFSDGDFIKECHVAVVDSVCPVQRSVFETVSLSSRTVRRRIEEMSQLACVPDACVSAVASMREEVASRFAGIKPLAADFKLFTPPLTFPWTTPLPPPYGVGGATMQWWNEGEVLQLFATVLLPRHRPPF